MSLFIIHVQVRVLPDAVETFRAATLANARGSVNEPGCARFDVVQDADDPTRFVLLEAYRSAEAREDHRKTAHYLAWRDAVAPLMAEPRSARTFTNVHPDDAGW
jgi:(4S)-4-hydroxy-5-phosphonooxypentane-2,3-dione isomerase